MQTVDAFYFFDEFDLLEIRLNILEPYVDYFVLIEATESFNGKPKPLYFYNNKNRYEKWNHKIKHYVVDNFPSDDLILKKALSSPNTGNKEHWWVREFYQKESLINALSFCSDNDKIFISDVDEIWNPDIVYKCDTELVYRPIQTSYPFYVNNRSNQNPDCWTGTRVGQYKTVKEKGPNHFRTERETPSIHIPNGGWHFSWLGKCVNKWDDNHPDNKNRFDALTHLKTWKDENNLPEYLIKNKEQWKHLFLD
jgi:beta-1,4-mannosyl-glycoprotein beta-1,4-N-acetylglucosaminyltransferase